VPVLNGEVSNLMTLTILKKQDHNLSDENIRRSRAMKLQKTVLLKAVKLQVILRDSKSIKYILEKPGIKKNPFKRR
jgi:metal-dependent HD superfamily phosphatase/phosphodiesterase